MEKKEKIKGIISLCIALVVCASILFIFSGFSKIKIEKHSMENTLMENERGLCNKRSYWLKDPERFDIIVFEKDEKLIIKRIIGLPGEKITYTNEGLLINGTHIDEDFLDEDGIRCTKETTDSSKSFDICKEELIIPEGKYFVMGDNREVSVDSRFYGYVDFEDIYGKVVMMFKSEQGKLRFI